MPYSFAHDYCAKRMLKLLPAETAAPLKAEGKLLSVGSQGPDIFFYHNIWPFPAREHLCRFARLLHTENIDRIFKRLLQTTAEAEGEPKRKFFAYLSGYLAHYALDCAAHPYVFNRAGFGPDHTRFEADMDVALIRLLDKEPGVVYKALFTMPSEADRNAAGLLLGKALEGCFESPPSSADVANAVYAMYRVQRFILDPSGLKRSVVGAVEKLAGQENVFTAAILPHTPDISIDSLNLSRRPWREPWKGGVASDERFVELLERAALDASGMVQTVDSFLKGSAGENEALLRIGARSFHTGRDYRKPVEFTETGAVWKRPPSEVPKRFRLPRY